MEGDHPSRLFTDLLGEDDERRELSPQARRGLMAAVAVLCVVATVVSIGSRVSSESAVATWSMDVQRSPGPDVDPGPGPAVAPAAA